MQRCPHCSETLDGLVPICWHCGRAVDTQNVPSERQELAPAAASDPSHEQNLFDQLWFEDDAAARSHHTAASDAELETWSTMELPAAAPPPLPTAPPLAAYAPPPVAAPEPTAPVPSINEPLAAASSELASSLESLAAALDRPPAVAPAVEPAAIKPAAGRAARPRWQLPAIGLAGVGTVAVVLSLMGRPASNAIEATAPASAPSPVPAAQPAASTPASAPAGRGATVPPAALAAARPAATATSASTVAIEEGPAWIVPRRTNWGPDGARTLTLQLEAVDDVRAGREQVRPVLAVRCLSRRTDVFVAIGTSASIEGGDTHTVTVQFDEEAPVKQQWPGSASYQELFAPDGMAVARRLAQTRMLRLTFTPFRARPVTAEFNVAGFDRHVKDVARICGWPGDAATARRK